MGIQIESCNMPESETGTERQFMTRTPYIRAVYELMYISSPERFKDGNPGPTEVEVRAESAARERGCMTNAGPMPFPCKARD
jgi:hypothetical protein